MVAFVLAVAVCFVFAVCGEPAVSGFLAGPAPGLAAFGRALSVAERSQGFSRGLVRADDVLFFVSLTGFWLFATVLLVDRRKASP